MRRFAAVAAAGVVVLAGIGFAPSSAGPLSITPTSFVGGAGTVPVGTTSVSVTCHDTGAVTEVISAIAISNAGGVVATGIGNGNSLGKAIVLRLGSLAKGIAISPDEPTAPGVLSTSLSGSLGGDRVHYGLAVWGAGVPTCMATAGSVTIPSTTLDPAGATLAGWQAFSGPLALTETASPLQLGLAGALTLTRPGRGLQLVQFGPGLGVGEVTALGPEGERYVAATPGSILFATATDGNWGYGAAIDAGIDAGGPILTIADLPL